MMLITQATDALCLQLAHTLNQHNFNYLVLADDFPARSSPPTDLSIQQRLMHGMLPEWLPTHYRELEFVFHLGNPAAKESGTIFRTLWQHCTDYQVPLIFRATAERTDWVGQQTAAPFFWAGLSVDMLQASSDRALTAAHRQQVADASYHLVHHRTRSGFYGWDQGTSKELYVSR